MSTATAAIDLGRVVAGSTKRIRFTITKDGVAWNLGGGSVAVTLQFEKPDRSTTFTRTMTAENAAGGIFYYDTTISDLDTVGYWTLGLHVVDGAVDMWYEDEISLEVVSQP